MLKNSYKLMFFITMMIGTLISISSSSWFSMWMGLEINLLSFIPLMMSSKNLFSSEASLKYFLTQAIASTIFLFSIILMLMFIDMKLNFINLLLTLNSSAMLLKMGAAPFHFWFPSVMEGLSWNTNLILMTWQKLAPLMILSYCLNLSMLIFIVIMSMTFGSLGGLNQTSLRKLMAFSSINHLGWMIMGMIYNESLWMTYFFFYLFLSMNLIFMFNNFKMMNINQTFSMFNKNKLMKMMMFIVLFSMGGLPPFLGFFPKWLIMELMIFLNLLFLLTIMMFLTLMTLFFYLRVSYSAILISNLKMNWNNSFFYKTKNLYYLIFLSFFSLTGLILMNLIFLFF